MPHTLNPNQQEIINWLRLIRTPTIGRATFFNLIKIFGNAKNAVENVAEFSLRGGRATPIVVCSEAQAQKELELTQKIGAQIIIFDDPNYPRLLKEIPDQPPILTVLGDSSLLHKNILAIVGPRNASLNGCKFAKKMALDLGDNGFVVVSGMARGVDTAAHLGSIEKGTIAVIAGGIDNIYPSENEKLYFEIAKKGVIVSEFPFGSKPLSGNFPQRNRIVSGLALGTIVVEATLKSGTLITARMALEQNREIFAVPGSPFDPRCQGTNRLIKDGAHLIENVDDVLAQLIIPFDKSQEMSFQEPEFTPFAPPLPKLPSNNEIDEVRKLILSKINHAPIAIEEIITEFEVPARLMNIAVVQLELADLIENQSGKICLKN